MVSSITYSNTSNYSNYSYSFKKSIFGYELINKIHLYLGCINSLSYTQDDRIEIIQSKKKLRMIEGLTDNWNGNGAESFSKELIGKIDSFIDGLEYQPEIFPTAGKSIQLEYDRINSGHIEFDVSEKDIIEVYEVCSDGKDKEYDIPSDVRSLNEVLKRFYDK